MKYNNKFRLSFFVWFFTASVFLFSSCDESLKINGLDEKRYQTTSDIIGYVINDEGKQETSSIDFRKQGVVNIYVGLSKEATENATLTLKYDPSVLKAYNQANKTQYALYPQESVTFNETVSISKGKKESEKTEVKIVSNETMDSEKSYVIPVKAEVKSGNIKLAEKESTFLIFAKDLTKLPHCNKATGIKIISCMEVNDTNPLNNLCFTLKNSGKPLIDMVILFSANINYNNETGKVYVYNNPNVQHLLDNREKYIKPLQDRGMKIVLGILGNHDRSGIANLADETARQFAQELKAVCDAYKLDGIFFDDEYSRYQTPPPPGFVTPSSAAAARLCYETKRAMPDKLVCAYVYSSTSSLPDIDGHTSGTFVDYGIHDYGGGYDLSRNYSGMPKSGMALYSQEFARGRWATENNLRRLRANGYGAHMIFAMDPLRDNFDWRQKPAMERIARLLFDDELVYDEKPYKKDW